MSQPDKEMIKIGMYLQKIFDADPMGDVLQLSKKECEGKVVNVLIKEPPEPLREWDIQDMVVTRHERVLLDKVCYGSSTIYAGYGKLSRTLVVGAV